MNIGSCFNVLVFIVSMVLIWFCVVVVGCEKPCVLYSARRLSISSFCNFESFSSSVSVSAGGEMLFWIALSLAFFLSVKMNAMLARMKSIASIQSDSTKNFFPMLGFISSGSTLLVYL